MSYNLVIVESPNKIKNIKEYLTGLYPRQKWEVAASVGHFTELSKKSGSGYVTAGVLENSYLTDNVVSESKISVFRKLQALAKDADTVFLATDMDREGEAIADSLQSFLRLKNPVRVLFSEITRSGVKTAMDNPAGRIDQNLVVAQRARRVLDRLVGFLVSPELYRLMGVSGVSAGRVQSPVLRLIYDRAHEISTFKANDFFDIILTGESEGKAFKAKLNTKPFQNENGYFVDAALAKSFSEVTDLELLTFEESERLKQPPSALTTSLMQQMASGILKIKPKQVMQAAQALFEAGLITYHRTDNPNLAAEDFDFIKENYSSLGVMPEQRMFSTGDDAQEAHPAITPTDFNMEKAGTTETEKQLYQLIRTYAIASQLLPAKYKVRKAKLKSNSGGQELEFNASGSELVDAGYLSFVKNMKDDEDDEETNLLPNLSSGFKIIKGECLAKKTKPPKIYTLKSLLARLAQLGIGRPATLDSIFETLEQRQYIIVDGKNQLMPTMLGERVLSRLVGKFEFMEYQFTSDMEKGLDLLAKGQADYIKVVHNLYMRLADEIKSLKTQKSDVEVHLCPSCNHPLKHFKKAKEYDFFGCTNREHCKFTADNIEGKPVERKKAELSNHVCPKCNERLVHRFKAGSHDFWGCSGFPNCDYSADNKDGMPVDRPEPAPAEHHCPDCSKPLARRTGKNAKGDFDFWGCTGFRDGCKKSFKTAEDGTPILA